MNVAAPPVHTKTTTHRRSRNERRGKKRVRARIGLEECFQRQCDERAASCNCEKEKSIDEEGDDDDTDRGPSRPRMPLPQHDAINGLDKDSEDSGSNGEELDDKN